MFSIKHKRNTQSGFSVCTDISVFQNNVFHVTLDVRVKSVVELIIERCSFLSDVDGGDVDDSVCEFFVSMNTDFGPICIGTQ